MAFGFNKPLKTPSHDPPNTGRSMHQHHFRDKLTRCLGEVLFPQNRRRVWAAEDSDGDAVRGASLFRDADARAAHFLRNVFHLG